MTKAEKKAAQKKATEKWFQKERKCQCGSKIPAGKHAHECIECHRIRIRERRIKLGGKVSIVRGEEKLCIRCDRFKPIESFKHPSLGYSCKECKEKAQQEAREKQRTDEYRAQRRDYTRKRCSIPHDCTTCGKTIPAGLTSGYCKGCATAYTRKRLERVSKGDRLCKCGGTIPAGYKSWSCKDCRQESYLRSRQK